MKWNKRISALLTAAMAAFLLLAAPVAAAEQLDPNRDVSLTICYRDEGTPIAGAWFDLYLAASVDESGQLTPTAAFAQYPVDFQGESGSDWAALASTLEGYVLRDQLSPTDSGETDEAGLLTFPCGENRLVPGLYLVLGCRHIQDGMAYDPAPFLVLLPGLDSETGAWIYDVTANPKFESHPDESETVTRKVLKVWEDKGQEAQRPQEITVQLLRDGEVFDTVTLNEENNWRFSWTELDGSCQWTVAEQELEGYTVEVTREGVTFVVTNTYNEDTPDSPDNPDTPTTPAGPNTPSNPKLPQTGQLWWPVPVLAAAGMLLFLIGLIRRRGGKNEG